MKEEAQLHVLTALTPRKSPKFPLGGRLLEFQSRYACCE